MKKFLLAFVAMLFTTVLFFGCQDNQVNSPEDYSGNQLFAVNMGYLTVELLSVTPVGSNYEWLYAVTNLNPSNSKQDMSHWGFRFICEDDTIQNYMVSAAYGSDPENMTSFTPKYAPDGKANQDCMGSDPLLKFDYGTSGSKTSYYKLVLSKNFSVGTVLAAYKSGSRGGCASGFEVPGPDCGTTSCGRETAFASAGACFLTTTPSFNRWGWVLGPMASEGSLVSDIYAGAGQCDLSKGQNVGTLTVDIDAGTVTYTLTATHVESHLYVGSAMFPLNNAGTPTVAPGAYNNPGTKIVSGNTVTYSGLSLAGKYVIAHAVVELCD
jgi:hypothetical protein